MNKIASKKIWPMRFVQAVVMISLLLVCTGAFVPVFAQDQNSVPVDTLHSAQQPAQEATGSFSQSLMVGSLLRTLAALAVVVVCIFAAVWVLKKMTRGRLMGTPGTETLQVLNTAYLGAKKSIALVKVADRAVLIGMTEQQMAPLLELNMEETKRVIAEAASKESQRTFGTILKQFTQGKTNKETANA